MLFAQSRFCLQATQPQSRVAFAVEDSMARQDIYSTYGFTSSKDVADDTYECVGIFARASAVTRRRVVLM